MIHARSELMSASAFKSAALAALDVDQVCHTKSKSVGKPSMQSHRSGSLYQRIGSCAARDISLFTIETLGAAVSALGRPVSRSTVASTSSFNMMLEM